MFCDLVSYVGIIVVSWASELPHLPPPPRVFIPELLDTKLHGFSHNSFLESLFHIPNVNHPSEFVEYLITEVLFISDLLLVLERRDAILSNQASL